MAGRSGAERARFERGEHGWRRVEDLDAWAGLPASTALDLRELPGGEVWVATGIGVIRVPPSARDSDRTPPPARVMPLLVDGVATGLSEPITVPAAHNR